MSTAEFEEHQRLELELLRRDIGKGLDDVEHGRTMSAERAFAEVDRELED